MQEEIERRARVVLQDAEATPRDIERLYLLGCASGILSQGEPHSLTSTLVSAEYDELQRRMYRDRLVLRSMVYLLSAALIAAMTAVVILS